MDNLRLSSGRVVGPVSRSVNFNSRSFGLPVPGSQVYARLGSVGGSRFNTAGGQHTGFGLSSRSAIIRGPVGLGVFSGLWAVSAPIAAILILGGLAWATLATLAWAVKHIVPSLVDNNGEEPIYAGLIKTEPRVLAPGCLGYDRGFLEQANLCFLVFGGSPVPYLPSWRMGTIEVRGLPLWDLNGPCPLPFNLMSGVAPVSASLAFPGLGTGLGGYLSARARGLAGGVPYQTPQLALTSARLSSTRPSLFGPSNPSSSRLGLDLTHVGSPGNIIPELRLDLVSFVGGAAPRARFGSRPRILRSRAK